MLSLLVVAALVGFSGAQVIGAGPCPNVQVQADFDLNRYLGVWYEIQRFPVVYQPGSYCVRAEYTPKEEKPGYINVFNQAINGITDELEGLVGEGYQPNPEEPAKLGVRFFENQQFGDYWVLDTDYESYSLVWSCSDLNQFGNAQSSWILARERKLDETIVKTLEALADSYGIPINNYQTYSQEYCPN